MYIYFEAGSKKLFQLQAYWIQEGFFVQADNEDGFYIAADEITSL